VTRRASHKRSVETARVPPANEREARNGLEASRRTLRACGAFAGGTPAVPEKRLSGAVPVSCL